MPSSAAATARLALYSLAKPEHVLDNKTRYANCSTDEPLSRRRRRRRRRRTPLPLPPLPLTYYIARGRRSSEPIYTGERRRP